MTYIIIIQCDIFVYVKTNDRKEYKRLEKLGDFISIKE